MSVVAQSASLLVLLGHTQLPHHHATAGSHPAHRARQDCCACAACVSGVIGHEKVLFWGVHSRKRGTSPRDLVLFVTADSPFLPPPAPHSPTTKCSSSKLAVILPLQTVSNLITCSTNHIKDARVEEACDTSTIGPNPPSMSRPCVDSTRCRVAPKRQIPSLLGGFESVQTPHTHTHRTQAFVGVYLVLPS